MKKPIRSRRLRGVLALLGLLLVPLLCRAEAPDRPPDPPVKPEESPVQLEIGQLLNTGIINNNIYSSAVRIGASGNSRVPVHSSLDFGFLENHRRKYIRFTLIGAGIEPVIEVLPRRRLGGFARVDLLSLTVAETGYIALTPGAELGGTFRVSQDVSFLFSLRQAFDIDNGKSSLTSLHWALVIASGPAESAVVGRNY